MICHIQQFKDMESQATITAYTPILSVENGGESKILYVGTVRIMGPKGESGPLIDFPIGAQDITDAFSKFQETAKAFVKKMREDSRKKILSSGAGLGVNALRNLRGGNGR